MHRCFIKRTNDSANPLRANSLNIVSHDLGRLAQPIAIIWYDDYPDVRCTQQIARNQSNCNVLGLRIDPTLENKGRTRLAEIAQTMRP